MNGAPTSWRALPEERTRLLSPAWFRLIDAFTGGPPASRVVARLQLLDGATWRPTEIAGVITPSGQLTYPGLGRRRVVLGTTPVRHRVQIEANAYRPLYRADSDGVEFDVAAYNDVSDPSLATARRDLVLLPGTSYPYPTHVHTLRGMVVEGVVPTPAVDALVENATAIGIVTRVERTLTDHRGAFTLPLRWVARGGAAVVRATNLRSGGTANITVVVPADLGVSQLIAIP